MFRAEMVPVAAAAAPHVVPPLNTADHSLRRRAGPRWTRPPAHAIGRAPLRPPIGAGHAPTAGNRTWKVTIGGADCRPRLPGLPIGSVFGVVGTYWAEWRGPPHPGVDKPVGEGRGRSNGVGGGAGQARLRGAAAPGALLLSLRPP